MRVELCAFADEAADAFTEQIAALDRNGIRKIELRGVNGCNVRDLSDTAARAAAAELRAAGISVWSIGSPLGKSDIGADFAPAQALLRRLLALCEIFSCDKIRVFSFFTRDPAADKAEVLRRLRILTETAVRRAAVSRKRKRHFRRHGGASGAVARCRALALFGVRPRQLRASG